MTRHAVAFAPGRANLIGEHTDYNEGLALPFAISEGVTVRASSLDTPRIDAAATDLGKRDSFALSGVERAGGWRGFVRGAAGELLGAGVSLGGASLEISGTVPRGAGLSSSAALEVALVLALLAVSGVRLPDRLDLAMMCSRIENDWVGAQTGLLDQISSLFGEADHALRIDFRSLDVRPVALELDGCRLVTLDSGEHHANVSSGYNERRAECAEACALLGVSSLREVTSLASVDGLPEVLRRRVTHVVTENLRVEEAVEAVSHGDMAELGRLIDASHASLRDCYEVSTPAVESAVLRLKRAGALGARIVGGGFGGHVLGLLPSDAVLLDDAVEVRPGDGARVSDS